MLGDLIEARFLEGNATVCPRSISLSLLDSALHNARQLVKLADINVRTFVHFVTATKRCNGNFFECTRLPNTGSGLEKIKFMQKLLIDVIRICWFMYRFA